MASYKIPHNLDTRLDLVESTDGRWMVLVNGFQWGPPGSNIDRSGASDATWDDPEVAMRVFMENNNMEDLANDHLGD